MSQVFVRKSTGALLFLVAVLSIVCVALLVLLLAPDWREGLDDGQPKPSKEPSASVAGAFSLGGKKSTTRSPMKTSPKTTTSKPILKEPWEKEYRIPKATVPIHYDLYLHPDLDTGLFKGRVDILIGVTVPMNFLVAHVKYMNVTKTELETQSGSRLTLRDSFEYEPNQFWVTRPKSTLKPGNYTLKLEFEGDLDGHIVGFYRSVYKTKANEKRSIATSKFQPTDARRAFPCFDEPSFKSTFTITMVRPSTGYIALSNMPVQTQVEDSPAQGLTEVVFQRSVPMVTYLVCFIVCDFEYVRELTQGGKEFRVYATSDQINRTQYALDLGVNVLNFFENYFEIEYPLPKQDMIAIPDFVSGAMEHWGLITYRETNLLYDDRESSSYNQQRVAAVVAHELAHMWFGNLVTLRWWDDLWLNEGFASYIEYKGVDHHERDWQMKDQFVCDDLHRALDLDAQLSSHPIVQPVNHPDEITEIFDAISYSKGASVLRMLEDFMGSEDFRKGIRNFLRKYIYDNAVTQDLWTELEMTSTERLSISRIMDSWTRQMGYPVLEVTRITPEHLHTDGQNTSVRVTQKRFLVDSEAVSDNDSPYGYVWDVAIAYKTDLTEREQVWFYREKDEVTLSFPAGASWVKLNQDTYGYYRVNYDAGLWKDIMDALRKDHTVFSPSDRSGLLDDAFNLAAAEQISYDTVFSLISYMSKEDDYVAWKPVASHLRNMGFLLKMTKAYPYYRRYVVQLIEGHITRLGSSDNGTHLERRLRPTLLYLACSHGEPQCLAQASQLLQRWLDDPSFYIPPNLRSYVYTFGMKNAGEKEWNILLERYKAEINAQEKDKMLSGLVNINSAWILQSFLDTARDESVIRTQNYLNALIRMARASYTGTQLVWSFVTAEWPWLVDRYTLNNRYLGRMIKYVSTQFTTKKQLQQVKDFFAANPEAGAGAMTRRQALEDIEKNIKWIGKNEVRLYHWLVKNLPSAS